MNLRKAIENLGGAEVLGGEVRSEVEFVTRIEEGLPARAVDELARLGDLTEADLGQIIPRRTLAHARRKERLSPEQSDRLVRAASVYARAHEVFASREKANRWMKRPNRVLEGKAPLSLLRTSSGTDLVETVLDRIAYGVYS
jgi:putative toxin-antitoxin system antitoxin component (TIGR02293 family)